MNKEMIPDEFAIGLCDYIEPRVVEICKKFGKGKVNMASLPAFWIGLEGDIVSFLDQNKFKIVKNAKPKTS